MTSPTHSSTRSLLLRLWRHLPAKRKVHLAALTATMLASAAAELTSLAAVVPFLSVLADPDRLWQLAWVRSLAGRLGIDAAGGLLLPLTLLFAGTALAAGVIRLVNLWLSGRVGAGIGSDLSQEAYRRTLYQPYPVHASRNSSDLIVAVTSHISSTITGVINPLLLLVTNSLVIVAMAVGLVLIDPSVAFLVVASFGGFYLLVTGLTRKALVANSRRSAECGRNLVQCVQEGIGGIRDVLLDRSQPVYLARYRDNDWPLRQLRARAELLSGFPRYVIEALGLVAVAGLAYLLVSRPAGLAGALPVLGALALGAQRLLPALQQSYTSLAQVQANIASLEQVLNLLDQPAPEADRPPAEPCPFTEAICLDRVSFGYGPDLPPVLSEVSLTIRRGDRVALVGPTGSGKSTLADIIMGLLPPTAGRLLIDGREVAAEAWQANIAHVPQSIFLADASIAANIALGLPPEQVDQQRLRAAAEQAQIAGFIDSLAEGFATRVGERGIRLSGGQRQRVGIARALYKQAPVLVLDEATSALDDGTEKALMDTLDRLSRQLTIIMIAHRLSTTAYCDRVIRVAGGSLEVTADRAPVRPVAADGS